jgi:manganese transport protein
MLRSGQDQFSLAKPATAGEEHMRGPEAAARQLSLAEMHGTVAVPGAEAGFWRSYWAYVGPALLVSVGYMDPGNWGTDLQGGAQFKYDLLWVVALASLMAIFMQVVSARLGVVTGKDLAQFSRDHLPAWTRWPNWIAAEIAIGACDLAEVLGSAVAINLLFHIPILWAVILTAADVLLLLALRGVGMRFIEAIVLVLISTIATCYFIEIFVLPQTKPDFLEMGRALVTPGFHKPGMLYVAIGIIGATVMPHNLYLHSALVQSRRLQKDDKSIRRAILFNTIDSTVALSIAFLINAAILVLAAMVFYGKTGVTVDGTSYSFEGDPDWIRIAYLTLAPLMGVAIASPLFAIALLASGQSSTITGTLAGQVVMEGFMHWQMRPWVRRIMTRLLAIVPAVVIIGIRHDSGVNNLLTLSQVVLALQLPLAMFPLLYFTSRRRYMGSYRNGWLLMIAGWSSCLLITGMDLYGLPESLREAWRVIIGQ